jgi:hypothetical protein
LSFELYLQPSSGGGSQVSTVLEGSARLRSIVYPRIATYGMKHERRWKRSSTKSWLTMQQILRYGRSSNSLVKEMALRAMPLEGMHFQAMIFQAMPYHQARQIRFRGLIIVSVLVMIVKLMFF